MVRIKAGINNIVEGWNKNGSTNIELPPSKTKAINKYPYPVVAYYFFLRFSLKEG